MKKLNLGCGTDIRKNYVNLDIVNLPGVDVVCDIDRGLLPFRDNTFDEVLALNILEHVRDLSVVMDEIHRICKEGAVVYISVPYWNSLITSADPTHRRGFTLDTFKYWEANNSRSYYFQRHFSVVRQTLIPSAFGKFLPFRRFLSLFFCNIVQGIYVELKVGK